METSAEDLVADILKSDGDVVLVHHGVKGQKWGVRKKEERVGRRKARRERRAQRHDKVADEAQKQIDEILANPESTGLKRIKQRRKRRDLQEQLDQERKNAQQIRDKGMTDRQKKILIGAGVTAGVLAAYGTYKFVDSGGARRALIRTPLKKNPNLEWDMSKEATMRLVVPQINTGYAEDAIGTKMNCRRCTFAYELRRRGYDVKATRTRTGRGQTPAGLLNALRPGEDELRTSMIGQIVEVVKEGEQGGPLSKSIEEGGLGRFKSSPQGIFDLLEVHPPRSRGEVTMKWKAGGGHSMAWELFDDGKAYIFDCQTGDAYSEAQFRAKFADHISEMGVTRLDNVNLNMNFLRKWVLNVQ